MWHGRAVINRVLITLDHMIIKIHHEDPLQSVCLLKGADLFFPMMYNITWWKVIGFGTW